MLNHNDTEDDAKDEGGDAQDRLNTKLYSLALPSSAKLTISGGACVNSRTQSRQVSLPSRFIYTGQHVNHFIMMELSHQSIFDSLVGTVAIHRNR